jgi:RNA polymerase sigma-70 factor (ECF subfamily)
VVLRLLTGNHATPVRGESPELPGKFSTTDAADAFRRYDPDDVHDSDGPPPGSMTDRILDHADSLYNLARYLTRNSRDAEDLVQETFIRALKAAPQLGEKPALKAWLFRILRNAFYDLYRSGKRERAMGNLEDEEIVAQDSRLHVDAELDLLRGLVGRDIEAAMSRLGEESRTVILLDIEGFTETEISGIMRCPVGTVKSRLMRARASLRKLLSQYAT